MARSVWSATSLSTLRSAATEERLALSNGTARPKAGANSARLRALWGLANGEGGKKRGILPVFASSLLNLVEAVKKKARPRTNGWASLRSGTPCCRHPNREAKEAQDIIDQDNGSFLITDRFSRLWIQSAQSA
jgi:hypothetical protein